MIIKQGSKFVLKSRDGSKTLGTFDTMEQAVKREKQINFFKHLDKRKKKRNLLHGPEKKVRTQKVV